MPEILWNRYEWQENRNSESISVFDSQKYQNELQSFYMRNQDNPESIQSLKSFVDHQEQDKSDLRESLESPILKETREELDKQAMINEAKTMLYEKMWISDNLSDNNWWENFSKWLVDTLVLDNYDLAIQIWETNWFVIIDSIKELFSSLDNIKKMAEALWESFMWLFSLDWYQTWKSIAELWLITTWVWAWVYLGKKWVKLWMKQIAKLRSNPERIVSSPEVKQVIWETTLKVDEIVPKQEINLRNEILENLPENVRNLDLELDNYSPQQLEWIKIRLWLDNKATIQDIDLAYRLKLHEVLERYKDLSDINLARFWNEILDELKKSWDINPIKTLEDEILKLELMKDRWELLVVSAMSDEVVSSGVKFNHFANLDRTWYTDFKNSLWTKEWNLQYRIDRNYNELRGLTDNLMWVEWLDPTYLSLVISKSDIHNLSQYWNNFMVFNIDELHWRATITMNDSMLAGRFNWNSLDTQLIHYSTETLIKAKAIYNIDERLNFPMFNRMRWEAFNENQRMKFFYQNMKPFIEVQVYWKTSDRVKNSLSVNDIMEQFKK